MIKVINIGREKYNMQSRQGHLIGEEEKIRRRDM